MQIGTASVRWRLVVERGSLKPKRRSAKSVGRGGGRLSTRIQFKFDSPTIEYCLRRKKASLSIAAVKR
ncbi:hypothetical protein HNY73_010109 [Argiope bruennichi]|uniref:Uncharacterized protein n=1 Tax=Argiope bruennichi TaxID=94029 RepID=A0A8T0F1S6_ARGBR|nr:hypothetical protein HNY73_010109 [Argiope bruennichi]